MKSIDRYSLYPSPDMILVKVIEPDKPKSIIHIPGEKPDLPQFGEIVAIGTKAADHFPPCTPECGRIAVGKLVGFSRHTVGMSKIVINGETFHPLRPGEINIILTEKPEEVSPTEKFYPQ